MKYKPPYQVTTKSLNFLASICELLGKIEISSLTNEVLSPQLRRENRIRTIHASLAIENNTLSIEQVTGIIEGKPVFGSPREIQEVKGAVSAYEKLNMWKAYNLKDILHAHSILMADLVDSAGKLRTGGVGVFQENRVIHLAPPAHLVQSHLENLLHWLKNTDEHPLISSCVFHYEFEFIHPFMDGNGRMGRLWQTLILSKWKNLFAYLPIETLIHSRQDTYYSSLKKSDNEGSSAIFIEFMIEAIYDSLVLLVSEDTNKMEQELTNQVKKLLKYLEKEPNGAMELMQLLGLKHKPTFRKNYITPALDFGFIEYTKPQSPRDSMQKYRLTEKGQDILKNFK